MGKQALVGVNCRAVGAPLLAQRIRDNHVHRRGVGLEQRPHAGARSQELRQRRFVESAREPLGAVGDGLHPDMADNGSVQGVTQEVGHLE